MKEMEIRTTQHVLIRCELAPLGARIGAFFIDLLVIMAFMLVLSYIVFGLLEGSSFLGDWGLMFLFGILPVFLLLGGQTLQETRYGGQTIGKRRLGIRVIRMDGQEAVASDFLLRNLFLLVDVVFSGGALAAFLVGTTPRAQRLGDMASQMVVVNTRSNTRFSLNDILGIQDAEREHQPSYPAVRKLSEQDMLLVKQTLDRYRKYKNAAHAQSVHRLAEHLSRILDIPNRPRNSIEFLKTLLRDYIVLTR